LKQSEIERAAINFLAENDGTGSLHRIEGSSMEPFLREGMLVRIEPSNTVVQIGDIVVYRHATRLIAHRVIARPNVAAYLICGDAQPTQLEHVSSDAILGRVTTIWPSGDTSDTPLSSAHMQRNAHFALRTRLLRALWAKVRDLYRVLVLPSKTQARAFATLFDAAAQFVQSNSVKAVDQLSSLPTEALLDIIGRHGMAGFLQIWLDSAEGNASERFAPQVSETLRKARIAATFREATVLDDTRKLLAVLHAHAIPSVLLKGAARLASRSRFANAQMCGDIDVLLRRDHVRRAYDVLHNAGYRPRPQSRIRREFYRRHAHHLEALWPPHPGVPIELHHELIRPAQVSQHLDYQSLETHIRQVEGPAGFVHILDPLAQALHLTYHADRLLPLRDIVLLAMLLCEFSEQERKHFNVLVSREKRNAVRLRTAVYAAELLLGRHVRPDIGTRWYFAWCRLREGLPPVLRHRSGILEGIFSHTGPERFAFPHYAEGSYLVQAAWRWCLNFAALPLIAFRLLYTR
jgi:hypothetical protein